VWLAYKKADVVPQKLKVATLSIRNNHES